MIELDEFRATMASYRDPLGEVKSSLDIENKTDRIARWNSRISGMISTDPVRYRRN